jgi:hypothetical protein
MKRVPTIRILPLIKPIPLSSSDDDKPRFKSQIQKPKPKETDEINKIFFIK